MTATRTDWTRLDRDARIVAIAAILTELPEASASEIAREFDNCSRSAIIGAIHRSKGAVSLRRMIAKPRAAKPPKKTPDRRVNVDRTKQPAQPVPRPEPSPLAGDPVPFLAVPLRGRQCRWPLWDELPATASEAPCCGSRVDKGESYCDFHRARSYWEPEAA